MYSVIPSTVAPCVTPGGSAACGGASEEREEGDGEKPGGAEAEGEGHGYLDDENRGGTGG